MAKRPAFSKKDFKNKIYDYTRMVSGKELEEASQVEVYQAVAFAIKDIILDEWIATHKTCENEDVRMLYYLSMEFLPGRLLGNIIINLSECKEIKEVIDELGFDLNLIEDREPDPGLGNGGLGRLAACFLDSLATIGYPATGCGIRYRYGMFRQQIMDGDQVELPDEWLNKPNPFELRREEHSCEIKFYGNVEVEMDRRGKEHFILKDYQTVKAVPYDIPIVGYKNNVVNSLRIWSAEPISSFELQSFNKGDYYKATEQNTLAKTIVEVLYPCDEHYAGKELRLKQQYFFVSATLQSVVNKFMDNHEEISNLPEKVIFQLNDTHPTIAISELMRILIDDYGVEWSDAWNITNKCCAYTNHTIMSEALEKWPVDLFSKMLPRCYQIIEELNRRMVRNIQKKYPGNKEKIEKMAIIYDGQIRMANLAISTVFSVNGVAQLHTEILKTQELKDFYEFMPEKFNNKTNGITQRRFLLHANPFLSEWVSDKIGKKWITDLSKIKELEKYADDEKAREEFMEIKYQNKIRLAKYIEEHNDIKVNPNSIFDVQVKRLHEYKRQLLNILHVMYLYNYIRENPDIDFYPRTFIFGAKAAAGYERAKLTIKLINSVAEKINNDKSINGKLKVVFIENYRVSNAEIIFAASDVSEQISTASKEASGTGNMKFMLNGALTIGTYDGANVEIFEEVGEENAFVFGLSSEEVIKYEKEGGYNPEEIFKKDIDIRKVLMQLINGFYAPDDSETFRDLFDSLLNTKKTDMADRYFILKDFRDYIDAHKKVEEAYRNRSGWARSAIINISNSGKFSSDRTVQEYVDDIWKLSKIKVELE